MCLLVTSTPYPNAQQKYVGRNSALNVITPKLLREGFLLAALLLHARIPVRLTQSARPSTLEQAIVRRNATTTLVVMVLDMEPTTISMRTRQRTAVVVCYTLYETPSVYIYYIYIYIIYYIYNDILGNTFILYSLRQHPAPQAHTLTREYIQ